MTDPSTYPLRLTVRQLNTIAALMRDRAGMISGVLLDSIRTEERRTEKIDNGQWLLYRKGEKARFDRLVDYIDTRNAWGTDKDIADDMEAIYAGIRATRNASDAVATRYRPCNAGADPSCLCPNDGWVDSPEDARLA